MNNGAQATFEIDEIITNDNYKTIISGFKYNRSSETGGGGGTNPVGIPIDDTSTIFLTRAPQFSFGNEFKDPESIMGAATLQSLVNGVMRTYNSAKDIINARTGTDFQDILAHQVKSLSSTISTWQGSKKLTLDLDFAIINTTGSDADDVLKQMTPYIQATNPSYSGLNFLGSFIPANQYSVTNLTASEVNGLLSLSIGRWFRTTPVFLMRDFNMSPSGVVLKDGRPYFIEAKVSFEAYRILTWDHIAGFFKAR